MNDTVNDFSRLAGSSKKTSTKYTHFSKTRSGLWPNACRLSLSDYAFDLAKKIFFLSALGPIVNISTVFYLRSGNLHFAFGCSGASGRAAVESASTFARNRKFVTEGI